MPRHEPAHLSQYCTDEDKKTCPLRNHLTKLKMLIGSVYLHHKPGEPYATLEVQLKCGRVFRRVNGSYGLMFSDGFWLASAEAFLDWLYAQFGDIILLDLEEVVKTLKRLATTIEVAEDGSTPNASMCEVHP